MTRRTWDLVTDELAFAFPGAESTPIVLDKYGFTGTAESETPQRYGAVGDGVTNDSSAFDTFIAATPATKIIPSGTYKLDSQWAPASRTLDLTIDPAATFTGSASPSLVDWADVIPYQIGPIWTSDIKARVLDASLVGYNNLFPHAFHVTNTGAVGPSVGLFVQHVVTNDAISPTGRIGFGANIVSVTDIAGAQLYGLEIDIVQALNAVGNEYDSANCLWLGSSGFAQPDAALVIRSSHDTSRFKRGIVFHSGPTESCISETLIFSEAQVQDIANGIVLSSTTFTDYEWASKSFVVHGGAAVDFLDVTGGLTGSNAITALATGADTNVSWNFDTKGTGVHTFKTGSVTQLIVGNVNAANSFQIQANAAGGLLVSRGSSTDSSSIIRGKGAGGVVLQDGGTATKFSLNTTGIGFFAASPTAQSTGWATQTAAASKADLGATPTVGAIASYISALNAQLLTKGLIAA